MQAIRILAAAALVLVASTAAAQGGQGGQGGMGRNAAAQNELLFKGITLTDAQKVQIDTIQAHTRTEMQALMQAGGMQDPGVREKMGEMRTKQSAAIRALLTAEQQPIYDKNLAEMPQGGGRRPPRLRALVGPQDRVLH